jgi:glucosamine--fructose-6-phosphate aminotransferase (isomerizing)
VEESLLFRITDYQLLTFAGREIGVASTKAFTMQVLMGWFYLLALLNDDLSKYRHAIETLSNDILDVLENAAKIEKIATNVYTNNEFLFTGRQILYPIALEGALKLKEIAYVHAEGYAAGELKHGPIALVDE